jgi:hypothetical protein
VHSSGASPKSTPDRVWSGLVRPNPDWLAWFQLIGPDPDWSGVSPKSEPNFGEHQIQ